MITDLGEAVASVDWVGLGNAVYSTAETVAGAASTAAGVAVKKGVTLGAFFAPDQISSYAAKIEMAPDVTNPFEKALPKQDRIEMCENITRKAAGSGCVPVILEKARGSSISSEASKKSLKLMLPSDYTVANLQRHLRSKIKLPPTEGIFLFIPGTTKLLSFPHARISEIYAKHKNEDGFLYLVYREECIFG